MDYSNIFSLVSENVRRTALSVVTTAPFSYIVLYTHYEPFRTMTDLASLMFTAAASIAVVFVNGVLAMFCYYFMGGSTSSYKYI